MLFMISISFGCKENKEMEIFLCFGQSNMAGRSVLAKEDSTNLTNVFLLNSDNLWEAALNPLNRYSTIRKEMFLQRLSPGWTFSKKLGYLYPEKKIGLVVNARGGSTIEEWKKGEKFYNEAVIRSLIAQKTGKIKAILWHQGEANENNWENYKTHFDSMVYWFRKDLNIPNLPVIVGEVGTWNEGAAKINQVLKSLRSDQDCIGFVSAEGLKAKDKYHFSTPSQRELGERYAKEVIRLVYQKNQKWRK